ncbi:MAG: hypothetical protein AAF800_00300 [Planctomycetota bacterium]
MIPWRRGYSSIGLDVTAEAVRAVQLRRVRSGWDIHETLTVARHGGGGGMDAAEARRIGTALRRRKFVGGEIRLALPNSQLIRGLLEVEPGPDGDALLAAAEEVERTRRLEPGTYELAAWRPTGASAGRRAAVCVGGCTHASAEAWLDGCAAGGWDVAVLDGRAHALGRVIGGPADAEAEGVTAVLDVDSDDAELVLLRGDEVLYQRPLPGEGLMKAEKPLVDAGIDPDAARRGLRQRGLAEVRPGVDEAVRSAWRGYAEGLAHEVEPAFGYARRVFADLTIRGFALAGVAAEVPALEYELRQRLRLEPATRHALLPADDRGAAVALGMALGGGEVAWAAA